MKKKGREEEEKGGRRRKRGRIKGRGWKKWAHKKGLILCKSYKKTFKIF